MSNNVENPGLSPSDMARFVYEAREELGWKFSDPKELLNQIKKLEAGLPKEDEFIALASWLGKCRLIHKLDQKQFPQVSKDLYQVPDLFAIFEYNDQLFPVLIEVKTTKTARLSWKNVKKLEELKRYAALLDLPLLIAWKCRLYDRGLSYWILMDAEILKNLGEKFQLTFESAYSENLLGQLAGDFLITIKSGSSLNFELTPIGDNWQSENSTGNDLFGKMRVFGADKNGQEIPDMKDDRLSHGLFSILQCIPLYGSLSSHSTDSTIIWTWKLEEKESLFLQQLMPVVLA